VNVIERNRILSVPPSVIKLRVISLGNPGMKATIAELAAGKDLWKTHVGVLLCLDRQDGGATSTVAVDKSGNLR
jgi:hypothetical protein